MKGLILNNTTPIALKLTSKQPSVFIDARQLAESLATVSNFTVGVRIRTSLGYPSIINRFQHIEVQPLLRKANTITGTPPWIFICGALVILAQLALIAHFVMAHRPPSTKPPGSVSAVATWRIRDRMYNDGVNGSQYAANTSLPVIEEAGDYVDDEDESAQLVIN